MDVDDADQWEPADDDPYMLAAGVYYDEPGRACRKRKRHARSPIVERAPRKKRSDAGVQKSSRSGGIAPLRPRSRMSQMPKRKDSKSLSALAKPMIAIPQANLSRSERFELPQSAQSHNKSKLCFALGCRAQP